MRSQNARNLLLAVALAIAPAASWAATPGAGLNGTAHDFAGGNGIATNVPGGVGVCTYCHTPHKALSTQLLWNHTLSTNTFSWDVAKTTAGTDFPRVAGNTYKGPSAKCLSCHDGSVAVGDIAWYKEQAWPTASGLVAYPGGLPTSGGTLAADFKMGDAGSDTSQFMIGPGGNMAGNHPVMMPYSYNQASNTYNASAGGAGLVLTEWQANPASLGTSHIRLFNDDGSGNITAGAVAGRTGIECSSCHDPHNKATDDDWFLRGKMQGSSQADGYICLQCHIK